MVTERYQLRTSGYAYMQAKQGEPIDAQQRSIERYISVHKVKILGWYTDRTTRRKALRILLDDLTRGSDVDYVLVYEPTCFGRSRTVSLQVEAQIRAYGAQVIYTSR